MNAVVHGRIGVRLNNFQDFLQVVGFLFVGLKLWGDVIGCCGMCRYYRCRSMHKSWFSFGFVGIMSRGVTAVFPAHCVCVLWHDPLSSLWGFLFQKVFGYVYQSPQRYAAAPGIPAHFEAGGKPPVTLKLRFPKWDWSWILYGIFFKRRVLIRLHRLTIF